MSPTCTQTRPEAWAAVALALVAVAACVSLAPAGVSAADDETDPILLPATDWLPEPVPLENADATAEAEMKPYTETIPGTSITFDMVPIPGGTFVMGSADGEPGHQTSEGPQFTVELEPFWMGKCEVTWNEYDLWLMGIDKLRRTKAGGEQTPQDLVADAITMPTPPYIDLTFGMGRDGMPAICMTQFSAKIYCKWIAAKTGRYYRLPSEAEWEYACRAGTTTAYFYGDAPAQLGDYAWWDPNCDMSIHRVGQKLPNRWGLLDMYGNAAEWVLDKFTPDGYPIEAGSTVREPVVVPEKEHPRVVRGGSYLDSDPAKLRSAARVGSDPSWKASDPQFPQSIWHHTNAFGVGFRVVRPLRIPTHDEALKYDVDAQQAKDYKAYPKNRGHE